jgi:aerobic-type carbon monoxide dehydrogenase small subunit (CoxS/CutS family)
MSRDKREELQLIQALRIKVSLGVSNKKHGNNVCGTEYVVMDCKMKAS